MDMTSCVSPTRYVRILFSIVNSHLLGHIEELLGKNTKSICVTPPVFVGGAPRSGSTLVTQVITDAFEFRYISNRHRAWFGPRGRPNGGTDL